MLRNHEHKAAGSGFGAALWCRSQYLGDWAHLQQALGPTVVIVTRYRRDVGAVQIRQQDKLRVERLASIPTQRDSDVDVPVRLKVVRDILRARILAKTLAALP